MPPTVRNTYRHIGRCVSSRKCREMSRFLCARKHRFSSLMSACKKPPMPSGHAYICGIRRSSDRHFRRPANSGCPRFLGVPDPTYLWLGHHDIDMIVGNAHDNAAREQAQYRKNRPKNADNRVQAPWYVRCYGFSAESESHEPEPSICSTACEASSSKCLDCGCGSIRLSGSGTSTGPCCESVLRSLVDAKFLGPLRRRALRADYRSETLRSDGRSPSL